MDCHVEYLWAIVMSDVWCCVMFELSWRHPFTAEEQVCNAKFLQICSQPSVKETNIYKWPKGEYFFQQIFIF